MVIIDFVFLLVDYGTCKVFVLLANKLQQMLFLKRIEYPRIWRSTFYVCLMESEKRYLKKNLGKNENNDLKFMVRSTSKSEGRRVKVAK